jgi:hypothetical protein
METTRHIRVPVGGVHVLAKKRTTCQRFIGQETWRGCALNKNGVSEAIEHTEDGRDHRFMLKHYHSVIAATLNGARTPQTTTAKQLWNGAGKTELTFVEISEIAGSTVSLRVVRRRYDGALE